jgi:hypothetical protein
MSTQPPLPISRREAHAECWSEIEVEAAMDARQWERRRVLMELLANPPKAGALVVELAARRKGEGAVVKAGDRGAVPALLSGFDRIRVRQQRPGRQMT